MPIKPVPVIIIVLAVAVLSAFFVYFSGEKYSLQESKVEYFPIRDPCDKECKDRPEGQNYNCFKLENNGYGCRQQINPTHPVIYTPVIPPELGEYHLILPERKVSLGVIHSVSVASNDSIDVHFKDGFNVDNLTIEKNEKFTGSCYKSKNLRVWTFNGMVEVENKNYIEMHRRLAKIPEGFDCDNPVHVLEKR